MATNKGFIKDIQGNNLLPITRGELVLDKDGNIALNSEHFLAGVNGSKYGLITAAERQMLIGGGGGNGGSLSDLYTKLGYINAGLTIGGKSYSFYDENGDATPITITAENTQINIAVDANTNNIVLGLSEVNTDSIKVESSFIRGIDVDEYGRVTTVAASALVNSDIPKELSEKKLVSCTTEAVADTDFAIVNKAYVDGKFNAVNATATGALKFGGKIADVDAAKGDIADGNKVYFYYKVVNTFVIPSAYTADGVDISVKSGDTLIIDGDNKFVHVPSGDDITSLTITKTLSDDSTQAVINEEIGNIALKFSKIFTIDGVTGNSRIANISIPQASTTTDGYLSASDYKKFSSYAENLATTYTSSILDTTPGLYTLGKINFGQSEYEVKGINTTYAIDLIDETVVQGVTSKHDPTLQFSENGAVVKSISYKGQNGISVTKDGDILKISQQENQSTTPEFLSIGTGADNNKFTINIGYVDKTTHEVVNGLTSYEQFVTLASRISQQIETITESLVPQEGKDNVTPYRYGNDKLKAAITLEI